MEKFINKIKEIGKDKIKFIFLFGSLASGKNNKFSDMDLAIYYEGNKKERFSFRKKVLSGLSEKYDVQIFQDLPLYIQKEILKGKLIYSDDLKFTYDIAYETIKKFEDFKKAYYDYINLEKIK